jgi:hypothetical protein
MCNYAACVKNLGSQKSDVNAVKSHPASPSDISTRTLPRTGTGLIPGI